MDKKGKSDINEIWDRRLKIRTLAVECAEHARLRDDAEPCDDGRAGTTHRRRKGDGKYHNRRSAAR